MTTYVQVNKVETMDFTFTPLSGPSAATTWTDAAAANINRRTVYEQRDRDEDFRLAMVDVQQRCLEEVEKTAFQRARDGVSDTAVIFWLKSRKPEMYGDKLRHEEREAIRAEARQQVIEELKREVTEMTPAARKVLRPAIPRS